MAIERVVLSSLLMHRPQFLYPCPFFPIRLLIFHRRRPTHCLSPLPFLPRHLLSRLQLGHLQERAVAYSLPASLALRVWSAAQADWLTTTDQKRLEPACTGF